MFQKNVFLMDKYRSLPEIPAGDEMLRKDHLAPQTHRVAGPCTTALLGVRIGAVNPPGFNVGYSEPSPAPP